MNTSENLFSTTRHLMDPAAIRQLSSVLGEPTDKVQTGLRSVIPTVVSELISKGSTPEGAREIVEIIDTEKFATGAEDIFGAHYHEVARSLEPETGLNRGLIERIMEMVTPSILKSLGKDVKDQNISTENLSGFLLEQKKVLKGFKPPGSSNRPSPVSDSAKTPWYRKKLPFYAFPLSILIISFALSWPILKEQQTVKTISRDISAVHIDSTRNPDLAPGVENLAYFLKFGNPADVPKTFSFRKLAFVIGDTDLSTIGNGELDFVAHSLMRFPRSEIKIQAYIENTGDPEENLLLSENRAMIVREELIGRGVEPSRIKAYGMGPVIGRGQVELIVRRLR